MEEFVKENIEMELFSSQEPCFVTQTQENRKQRRHMEHPLVQCTEEEPRQSQSRRSSRAAYDQQGPAAVEDTLIEMEVLRPLRRSNNKIGHKQNVSGLKWKKLPPQNGRFVVKDVVFLSREQHLAQVEGLVFSPRPEVSPVRARVTVDRGWSAQIMDGRLRLLLRREFGKAAAKGIHFMYLQCVQSSRSLFIPSAPADGWSGANVLHMSALGPLYVLIQHDTTSSSTQVKLELPSPQPLNGRKNLCLDITSEDHTSNESSEEVLL